MTTSEPVPPSLRALVLPAKDIARGLRHTLARSRSLTAPMRETLPDPMRDLARRLIAELEGLAGSARGAAARAKPRADSLAEIDAGPDPAVQFARAAVFGLEAALTRLGRGDLMASETVAAMAFGSVEPGGPPQLRAARLALALQAAHAAGLAPGTPLGMGSADLAATRRAAVAVALWMLVERDGPEDAEALVGLCVDVVGAIGSAADSPDAAVLAETLAAYATVV